MRLPTKKPGFSCFFFPFPLSLSLSFSCSMWKMHHGFTSRQASPPLCSFPSWLGPRCSTLQIHLFLFLTESPPTPRWSGNMQTSKLVLNVHFGRAKVFHQIVRLTMAETAIKVSPRLLSWTGFLSASPQRPSTLTGPSSHHLHGIERLVLCTPPLDFPVWKCTSCIVLTPTNVPPPLLHLLPLPPLSQQERHSLAVHSDFPFLALEGAKAADKTKAVLFILATAGERLGMRGGCLRYLWSESILNRPMEVGAASNRLNLVNGLDVPSKNK